MTKIIKPNKRVYRHIRVLNFFNGLNLFPPIMFLLSTASVAVTKRIVPVSFNRVCSRCADVYFVQLLLCFRSNALPTLTQTKGK